MSIFKPTKAFAHCDIPCGIYDPISAQLSALSVIRFSDLILELGEPIGGSIAEQSRLIRLVEQKESHAGDVKTQINIIWGDYFKIHHLDKHPELPSLTHRIMQSASSCKQTNSAEEGRGLLELINQFAEFFWSTKEIETRRVIVPYQPALPIVQPVLPQAG